MYRSIDEIFADYSDMLQVCEKNSKYHTILDAINSHLKQFIDTLEDDWKFDKTTLNDINTPEAKLVVCWLNYGLVLDKLISNIRSIYANVLLNITSVTDESITFELKTKVGQTVFVLDVNGDKVLDLVVEDSNDDIDKLLMLFDKTIYISIRDWQNGKQKSRQTNLYLIANIEKIVKLIKNGCNDWELCLGGTGI